MKQKQIKHNKISQFEKLKKNKMKTMKIMMTQKIGNHAKFNIFSSISAIGSCVSIDSWLRNYLNTFEG